MHITRIAFVSFALLAAPAARANNILKVPQQFATISDAIASLSDGDEIDIASGTYAEVLALDTFNNVTLRGKGVVKLIAPQMFVSAPQVTITNCSAVNIVNLRIGLGGATNIGFSVADSIDVTFDKCRVTGGQRGFDITSGDTISLKNCKAQGCLDTGVLASPNTLSIESCDVTDCGAEGIETNAVDNFIHANTIKNCPTGILLDGDCLSLIASDNHISDSSLTAIFNDGVTTTTGVISGNHISGGLKGIDDSSGLAIEDNHIKNTADVAITVFGNHAEVSGNHVKGCLIGLSLQSACSQGVFTANKITNSTTVGLIIDASAFQDLFIGNVVTGSGTFDLEDQSPNANDYIDNTFGTIA